MGEVQARSGFLYMKRNDVGQVILDGGLPTGGQIECGRTVVVNGTSVVDASDHVVAGTIMKEMVTRG